MFLVKKKFEPKTETNPKKKNKHIAKTTISIGIFFPTVYLMAAAIDANPKTKNNKLNKKWS